MCIYEAPPMMTKQKQTLGEPLLFVDQTSVVGFLKLVYRLVLEVNQKRVKIIKKFNVLCIFFVVG